MKIVNTSNGKFKITNSLFESIIKNNPELIMEKMESDDDFQIDGTELRKYAESKGIKLDASNFNKIVSNYLKDKEENEVDEYFYNGLPIDILKKLSNEERDDYIKIFKKSLKDNDGDREKAFSEIGKKLEKEFSNEENKEQNNKENNEENNKENNKKYKKFFDKPTENNKDTKNIADGEIDSVNAYISENEIQSRTLFLQSHYLTNESADYLIQLCSKYNKIQNNEKEIDKLKKLNPDIIYKIEDINNLYKVLYDANNAISHDLNKKESDYRKIRNENAIKIRKVILGFEPNVNDFDFNSSFNKIDLFGSENKKDAIEDFQIWYKKNKKILESKKNLLGLLTDTEWKNLLKTLNYPNDALISKNKNQIDEFVGRLTELIKEYTFEGKKPDAITNFYEELYKQLEGRLVRTLHLKFFDFGKKILSFMRDRPKKIYIDMIKNSQKNYRGIRLFDVYRSIDMDEYWKNVGVILCRSKKGLNLVNAALNDLSTRAELNLKGRTISTGLNTITRIYTIDDTDIKKLQVLFGHEQEINDYDVNPTENDENNINKERIKREVERIYFIVVTEGLIEKGKIASNIFKNVSNGLKKINKSKSKSLGDNITNTSFMEL